MPVNESSPPQALPSSASAEKTSDLKRPVEESKLLPAGLVAPISTEQLTPEEQMRLFEKELKEKDWGHQPC